MSDISKQNKRNRTAGKSWERDIMQGARTWGVDYERTRDTGTKDEGDGVIRQGGHYIVVEAKNAKLEPTGFIRESEVEAEHFAEHRNLPRDLVHPVVFVKRRGKGFLDGMALMTIGEYLRLVESVGK